MPRPRFKKLDENKQQHILSCAAREFAANGYHDASFNRIMEETGVSKGAMYYYFDDKLDLYRTVIVTLVQGFDRFLWARELQSNSEDSFWESIELTYLDVMGWFLEEPERMALYKGLWKLRGTEGQVALEDVFCQFEKWERHIIVKGREHGYVRTDLPEELLVKIALGIASAFDDWVIHNQGDEIPQEAQIRALLSMQLSFMRETLSGRR